MRITESQLRRIVKRLVKEQAMPSSGNYSAADDIAGEVASRWMESGKDPYATIGIAEDLMDEIFDAFGKTVAGNDKFVEALQSYGVPEDTAVSIANTCYDAVM